MKKNKVFYTTIVKKKKNLAYPNVGRFDPHLVEVRVRIIVCSLTLHMKNLFSDANL